MGEKTWKDTEPRKEAVLSKSCKEIGKKTWKDTEPSKEASHARRYG
jgi:hypothetical protein